MGGIVEAGESNEVKVSSNYLGSLGVSEQIQRRELTLQFFVFATIWESPNRRGRFTHFNLQSLQLSQKQTFCIFVLFCCLSTSLSPSLAQLFPNQSTVNGLGEMEELENEL